MQNDYIKPCSICGEDHTRKEHIAKRQHDWYIANKPKIKEQTHRRYLDHKDEAKASAKKWKQANKAKVSASSKRYRERNINKERERRKQYKINNRDKYRQYEHNRRALKRGCKEKHTQEDIARQVKIQNDLCWWCGKKMNGIYEIDHLIPLARGGHNGPSNLVLSHASCNRSKGDKMPDEWIGRLF